MRVLRDTSRDFLRNTKGALKKSRKKLQTNTKNIASESKISSATKNVFLRNVGGGFDCAPRPGGAKEGFSWFGCVWAATALGRVGLEGAGEPGRVGWEG